GLGGLEEEIGRRTRVPAHRAARTRIARQKLALGHPAHQDPEDADLHLEIIGSQRGDAWLRPWHTRANYCGGPTWRPRMSSTRLDNALQKISVSSGRGKLGEPAIAIAIKLAATSTRPVAFRSVHPA